jgi:protein-L-isoaspartate(D-aspartate) O-methyltransferase
MVLQVEGNAWGKLIQSLTKQDVLRSPRVIDAMRSVPRERFLPENMRAHSAEDTPLPIGFGQTASAPHSLDATPRLGETWFQS